MALSLFGDWDYSGFEACDICTKIEVGRIMT